MQNINKLHHQRYFIAACVLLLHAIVLWALQTGLLQRVLVQAQELVVPVALIEPMTPPKPLAPKPPPHPSPSLKAPVAAPRPSPALPAQTVAPVLLAIADTTASANAPVGVVHAPAAVAPAAAPAAKVELPSSDAEYLHNPKSEYPRISRQRNEQGRVLVSVFIGADGVAQKAEIKVSSGFDRLDQAALATVKSWRYVPGKRAGVAEAMWFTVPINFVLE